MYKLLIIDQNTEVEIREAKAPHPLRIPQIGEHLTVKYQGVTKICEVEDVWTNISLDAHTPVQGAIQVIVRWSKGLDPSIYIRRFR